MKIKLLMIGLLGLISVAAFAQKKELQNAQDEYTNYEVSKSSKVAVLVTKAKQASTMQKKLSTKHRLMIKPRRCLKHTH